MKHSLLLSIYIVLCICSISATIISFKGVTEYNNSIEEHDCFINNFKIINSTEYELDVLLDKWTNYDNYSSYQEGFNTGLIINNTNIRCYQLHNDISFKPIERLDYVGCIVWTFMSIIMLVAVIVEIRIYIIDCNRKRQIERTGYGIMV